MEHRIFNSVLADNHYELQDCAKELKQVIMIFWFVYCNSYHGGLIMLADIDGTYSRYSMGCQGFIAMYINLVLRLRPWIQFVYCNPWYLCYNYYVMNPHQAKIHS